MEKHSLLLRRARKIGRLMVKSARNGSVLGYQHATRRRARACVCVCNRVSLGTRNLLVLAGGSWFEDDGERFRRRRDVEQIVHDAPPLVELDVLGHDVCEIVRVVNGVRLS